MRKPMVGFRLFAALAGAAIFGCFQSDKVAGTSTGVDNPSLTVAFADGDGAPQPVSGALEIYLASQNPILDPEPLLAVKLEATPATQINAADFSRAVGDLFSTLPGSETLPLAKAGTSLADPVEPIHFNLLLRGEGRRGAFAGGLSVASGEKPFRDAGQSIIEKITLVPAGLVDRVGDVEGASRGDLPDRLFIPGSPFVAALTDSGFVVTGLPPGEFPVRLQKGDGRILEVEGELDSRLVRQTLRLNDTVPEDSLPDGPREEPLTVTAGEDRIAFTGEENRLQAVVTGEVGERLNFVWSVLSHPDFARPPLFSAPTAAATAVKFIDPGPYTLLVTVQDGLSTAKATLFVDVRLRPPPEPKFLYPEPEQVLVLGVATRIAWESPFIGTGRLEISLDEGATWKVLAEEVLLKPGLNSFAWTPPLEWEILLPEEQAKCLIRLLPPEGEPLVMQAPFILSPAFEP